MKPAHYLLSVLLLQYAFVSAQGPVRQGDLKELFKGPDSPAVQATWWRHLLEWRHDSKKALRYTDSVYHQPGLQWQRHVYMYAQVMACDRYLFDAATHRYTVDKFLDDVIDRYGGLEAVLIWPTYPNIGIDDRNQLGWVAAMPGGREGVRRMIGDFHRRGVKVFFPIMIWDNGTKPIGEPMPLALVREMKELGADGLNGDTMFGVTEDFLHACDSLHYPLALQPEVAIDSLDMVKWNTMSWGYYWKYEYTPGVSVYKWLEPLHQVHITNRWIIDRTDDLQYAFFNGVGLNTWENIWGIWNGITERDAAAIRRIGFIYRQFPDAWSSPNWRPHIPTIQRGVFATSFPRPNRTLYTLVNRDSADKNGPQLELPYKPGRRFYDIYNGKELRQGTDYDRKATRNGKHVILRFPIEGGGFTAVLETGPEGANDSLNAFLQRMHATTSRPLRTLSDKWTPLQQKITPIEKTRPYTKAPEGMVLIPAASFRFKSEGVMIEGNDLPSGIGVQHPWQQHPSRSQDTSMPVEAFYIDRYPVTNSQYKAFLVATHYHPAHDYNFLRDWTDGSYPAGWDDKPVTWVSIEDARAYAAWAGKRLPHEWEWQYAAGGTDDRRYPWGNTMDSSRIPVPDKARTMRGPTSVDVFPAGASPFGVMDMTGNVWQWTDEYTDSHTRSAVLKGGSYYHPKGSDWYFPQAPEIYKYGKYLLMSPDTDRSGTIGFRCAADK